MTKRGFHLLIVCVGLSEATGAVGSIFTAPNISPWYDTLNKSSLTPPSWVFGPVWGILFLLIGLSAYIVFSHKGLPVKLKRAATYVFGLQLALNVLWSIIFFGMRSPGWALLEMVVLWLSILANIYYFYRVSRLAGYLLIPYVLWVSFAAYLNYCVWALN